MLQVAQIRSEHGALLLPAGNPYDREVVFEEAEFRARRDGAVGLRIGGAEMRVARCEAGAHLRCSECHQSIAHVSYVARGRCLCTGCAKHSLR